MSETSRAYEEGTVLFFRIGKRTYEYAEYYFGYGGGCAPC